LNLDQYKNDPDDSLSLSQNEVVSILEDHNGNLWVGTNSGGLNKFNREKQNFTSYQNDPNNPNSLSNDLVPGICEDKSGALWLGTYGGGICKLTFSGENYSPVFTNFKYDPGNPAGISSNNID